MLPLRSDSHILSCFGLDKGFELCSTSFDAKLLLFCRRIVPGCNLKVVLLGHLNMRHDFARRCFLIHAFERAIVAYNSEGLFGGFVGTFGDGSRQLDSQL